MHSPPNMLIFDRQGVRNVDRVCIEEFGIAGIVLMENAARELCTHASTMLRREDSTSPRSVLIVCGSGNNGGDGYALARHLHNCGTHVTIASIGSPKPDTDAGINRRICERMHLRLVDSQCMSAAHMVKADLIVDAIFGTGLDRAIEPDSEAARLITLINGSGTPVLAVDVPSGMDCNTGLPASPDGLCVTATLTATFVGKKIGFLEPHAPKWLGETVICDIGAPRELIERMACHQGARTRGQPRR